MHVTCLEKTRSHALSHRGMNSSCFFESPVVDSWARCWLTPLSSGRRGRHACVPPATALRSLPGRLGRHACATTDLGVIPDRLCTKKTACCIETCAQDSWSKDGVVQPFCPNTVVAPVKSTLVTLSACGICQRAARSVAQAASCAVGRGCRRLPSLYPSEFSRLNTMQNLLQRQPVAFVGLNELHDASPGIIDCALAVRIWDEL